MGIRPKGYVVFGYDDWKVEKYKIVDARFHGNADTFSEDQEDEVDLSWVEQEELELAQKLKSIPYDERERDDAKSLFGRKHSLFCAKYHFKEHNDEIAEEQWANRPLYETMYSNCGEFGIPNIFGFIVDRDSLRYDCDWFRLLSVVNPEFQQSGYKLIPSVTDHEWLYKQEFVSLFGKEFMPWDRVKANGWLYPQGYNRDVPIWLAGMEIICKQCKVDFEPDKCKLMLVWGWG